VAGLSGGPRPRDGRNRENARARNLALIASIPVKSERRPKADVLTTFVPLDIPGIELLMREEGGLQRYPQDRER
jgi:hypothetical protein